MKKLCPRCHKKREFSPDSGWCKKCTSTRNTYRYHHDAEYRKKSIKAASLLVKRYLERYRLWRADYCRGKICVDCGNSDARVFQFDHRDPNEKEFNFGVAHHKSPEELTKEADKCDIRCANCHIIRHWKDRQSSNPQAKQL